MERRLGRGLGSLLPQVTSLGAREEVEIDRIRPNPLQPREIFDPQSLKELTESIAQHGVLQPILVRPVGDTYEIVSGERRWRAARAAGLTSIPVAIRSVIRDEEMLELALVENLQRKDLSPIELAKGFLNLMEALGLTQDQVATKVGLPRTTVTNHLRLLELSPSIQKALEEDMISMGHAKALLGVHGAQLRQNLLAEIVRKGLSVRDIERKVRSVPSVGSGNSRSTKEDSAASWVKDLESRMRSHLGTKVVISHRAGVYQGEIIVHYFDRQTLDRLIGVLAKKPPLD